MRDGFFFYENFKATADTLPDDMRLKFYDALTAYAINGIEPDDGVMKALITAFKPSLDKVENRGGAREGAGRPKKSINQELEEEYKNNQKNQNNSNEIKDNQNIQSFNKQETGNKKQEIKEKNTLKGIKKETQKFIKPSLDEIRAYCQERGNDVQAERFYDFYESKGWRVGNQAMKDWMAAVRTWENKNRIETKQPDDWSWL